LLLIHGLQETARAAAKAGRADPQAAADAAAPATCHCRAEPTFTFVRRVSAAERADALARAVLRARQSAAELARAAGGELGPVHQLVGAAAPSEPPAGAGPAESDLLAEEATGNQPAAVAYRVTATVTYALKAR
jgi:uncharacterized protein YggE